MAAVAPFIPLISTGVGMAYDAFKNRGSGSAKDAEKAAMAGGMNSAGNLNQFAQQQAGFGQPLQASAAGYYQKLLNGDRASLRGAIAPEVAGITETYRGAEKNLERSGVRGAQRDVAKAEIGRDRAGKIAGLLTGQRAAAAGSLGEMGNTAVGNASTAYGNAGSIYSAMSGHAGAQVARNDANSGAMGAALGKGVADALKNWKPKAKGGGGSTAPLIASTGYLGDA